MPDLDKARRLGVLGRLRSHAQEGGGTRYQGQITERFGGRNQQQSPRVRRKIGQLGPETPFDNTRNGRNAGEHIATGQVSRADTTGQLDERQGITSSFRDDAITHTRVQRRSHLCGEKSASVFFGQAG